MDFGTFCLSIPVLSETKRVQPSILLRIILLKCFVFGYKELLRRQLGEQNIFSLFLLATTLCLATGLLQLVQYRVGRLFLLIGSYLPLLATPPHVLEQYLRLYLLISLLYRVNGFSQIGQILVSFFVASAFIGLLCLFMHEIEQYFFCLLSFSLQPSL